jgi:hypothetical protein
MFKKKVNETAFADPLIRLLTSLQKAADSQHIQSPLIWMM